MFIFPLRDDGTKDAFDLATFTEAQTLYVRLGPTGMVAVFDDSCAAVVGLKYLLSKIDAPVSTLQAREIAARMALANLDLINRPKFWTHIRSSDKEVSIGGTTDDTAEFQRWDPGRYGQVMASVFPTLPTLEGFAPDEAMEALRSGHISFLFDSKGNFIREHAPVQASVYTGAAKA